MYICTCIQFTSGKSGVCASESKQRFLLTKMIELSAIVGGVFVLSFGPFLYHVRSKLLTPVYTCTSIIQ